MFCCHACSLASIGLASDILISMWPRETNKPSKGACHRVNSCPSKARVSSTNAQPAFSSPGSVVEVRPISSIVELSTPNETAGDRGLSALRHDSYTTSEKARGAKFPKKLDPELSLGDVYMKVKPEVARMAHSMLAAVPPSDLIHDACVAVVFSIDRFRKECAFSSWLYAVVARHVRRWVLAEQRHRELLRTASMRIPPVQPELPDTAAFARLKMGRLKHALDKLPKRQRICLELVYFEAQTASMVARQLGTSPDAVRMTIYRARQELRRLLGEE